MKNVYFASFGDCVSKIGSIVNHTMASKIKYVDRDNIGYLEWPPYNGPISIGDDTAQLNVSLPFPRSWYSEPIFSHRSISSCAYDNSSYNADGAVIPNSAMDIFYNSLNADLLQSDLWFGGPHCQTRSTPENICQPFKSIGPYNCVKTTKITQPILQVLGSSLSNAATLMTILSVALAWILKKVDERVPSERKPEEKVAPTPETAVVAPKE